MVSRSLFDLFYAIANNYLISLSLGNKSVLFALWLCYFSFISIYICCASPSLLNYLTLLLELFLRRDVELPTVDTSKCLIQERKK
jgi:hypothetical protein